MYLSSQTIRHLHVSWCIIGLCLLCYLCQKCRWFFLQRASWVHSYGHRGFSAAGYKHRCTNAGVSPSPEIFEKPARPREVYVSWALLEEKHPLGEWHGHTTVQLCCWKKSLSQNSASDSLREGGLFYLTAENAKHPCQYGRGLQETLHTLTLWLPVPDWSVLFSFWVCISHAPWLSFRIDLIVLGFDWAPNSNLSFFVPLTHLLS